MKNVLDKLPIYCKTFLFTTILVSNVGVYADDTEIFYSLNVSKPNLLFVLDNSGSMNGNLPGGTQSKMSVLQQSVQQVLLDAPDNVNIGLMRFGPGMNPSEWNNTNEGNRTHGISGVAFPLTDINAKARDVIPATTDVYGLGILPTVDEQVRSYAATVVNNWTASGGTPLVGALYEAALYFRGEQMRYGYDSPSGTTGVGAHPTTYDGSIINNDVSTTTRNYTNAPRYKTPIESSCQANYIVLMSDGNPTYYYNGAAETQGADWSESRGPFAQIMQGNAGFSNLASAVPNCADEPNSYASGKCGPELTEYISTNDNLPDPTSAIPYGQPDNQFIETFTIGFGTGAGTNTEGYLKSLATYDDGNPSTNDDGYFLAQNPADLASAFKAILAEVAAPKGTLASPGYSVNVKNGLEHEKDIYIPVFDRKNSSRWSGNLKKFKIVDSNNKRLIVGKNDKLATDELGNFTFDALDYWSSSSAADPDGRDVQGGGVANLIDPDTRNIFSNLTGNNNVTLNNGANKVDLSNISNLTNAALGLSNTSTLDYRKRIVSFMRGWENGETNSSATPAPKKRYHMGDMLHSEPLVMTYNKGSGASSTGKKQYIFAGTNEGYLHAFDAESGEEKFAFIPADLLRTLSEHQFLNAGTQKDHKYGIDGAITGDFIGGDDGVLDAGDQIIIYFGMRRGGTAYYALDVTDIDSPKLLWKKSAADHPSMGQSWATPYVARVGDSSGNSKDVVIVTGGYDEDEDRDTQTVCADENQVCTVPNNQVATVFYGANTTWVSKHNVSGNIDCNNATFGDPLVGVRKKCKYELNNNDYDSTLAVTADVGNDLFIFDAQSGNKIWSMTSAMRGQISNSIAGGIRPLDTNNNNLVDRIYFGDTGGNVWRLDLSENNGSTTSPTKLTKLASLGGTGTNNRMFFNEPDIALMRLNGRSVYTVSIGSGFRAHPMDQEITDKFYVLLDESPFAPLETQGGTPYTTITEGQLSTITVSSGGAISTSGTLIGSRGWMINLPENGEKVLGDATAVNGSIIFPTLVPEVLASGVGIDQCAAPITYSRLYAIDILTGTAKWDLNGDGTPVPFSPPLTSEIISSVDKVFNTPKPDEPVLGTDGNPTGDTECNHTVDLRVGKKSSQVSGYNACRLESVYWSDPAEAKN